VPSGPPPIQPSADTFGAPTTGRKTRLLIGGLALLVVVLAAALVVALLRPSSEARPAAQAPPAQQAPAPGPAPVTVASTFDAATIVLTDGTRLRQVGITAPPPETCQAKRATATTDNEVRRDVLTYQLLNQTDVYGNQWAYIKVGSVDLGEKLATTGWVYAYTDSPAPQEYNQRITNAVEAARTAKSGLFGNECPGAAAPAAGGVQPSAGATIENGTWVVGSDIQPGTYRTTGPSNEGMIKMACIWKRLKDTSGEITSTLAINVSQGPTIVTIKPTDGAFDSQNCAPWVKVN
jgi:endonuclease YncB( thermonuclease family)